ncbi:NrdH-redoxin [Pseudoclavibacter sp. VKM Ac-2867]|nr:NrdH-redoxin [Pseudoclavibacter sp. VKM Ac-2867]
MTVLATVSCVQCTATKRKLENDGVVPFEYRMLTDDEREHCKSLGHMQAPIVIDHATGALWTGNNPIELMRVTAEEKAKLAA